MLLILAFVLCIIGAILGFIGFVVYAFFTTRDLAVIKDVLGIGHKTPVPQKTESLSDDINRGFDSGVNFAFLCMYKMYIDDGMIIGDYDCVSDQLDDTVRNLLKDPAEYQKTYDMLTDYNKDKKDY